MKPDLDGKTFRSVANSPNGEAGAATLFHYHQTGNRVAAEYSGGAVVSGHLIALMLESGELDMRYHHLNTNGELRAGTCRSTPEWLPDGRLKMKERWRWLSGDFSEGYSEIEEVVTPP